jgi:8-oxo-dGTP pyrophosphatase MutT (NUDIX family)
MPTKSPDLVHAAGILFLTPTKKVLLLQRGPKSDHPGEWCIPGGMIEDGETAEDAAVRETMEEVGDCPDCDGAPRVLHTRRIADGVDFTTFLQKIDEPFSVKLSSEHTGYAWVGLEELK